MDVPMMTETYKGLRLREGRRLPGGRCPVLLDEMSMTILLPDEGTALEALEGSLDSEMLDRNH